MSNPIHNALVRRIYSKYRNTAIYRARNLYHLARYRARKAGLEFTITKEAIVRILKIGVCQATGIKFEYAEQDGSRHKFTPTLDRKDPKIGYTKENTRVVIWMYNAAKNVFSDDDVRNFAQKLVNSRKPKIKAYRYEKQAQG